VTGLKTASFGLHKNSSAKPLQNSSAKRYEKQPRSHRDNCPIFASVIIVFVGHLLVFMTKQRHGIDTLITI
jgi:hypothetical protein